MKERVQKLMAQANIASRRASEELIQQGRVQVNGKVIGLGDQADPEVDVITVDGERLRFSKLKRYYAVNKPHNVLSAPTPGDDRPLVREMIPYDGHLFTIGRLDADSDGLMVLTNDGELANQLSHPRFEHTKTYKVEVYGNPSRETLEKWERGVWLEEGLTAPCSIRVHGESGEVTVLRIVMIEGKKRQIRRIASMLGHPVKKLTRTHIGQLELGKLQRGEWYELEEEDIEKMKQPVSDISYIKRLRREQRSSQRTHSPSPTPRPAEEREYTDPNTGEKISKGKMRRIQRDQGRMGQPSGSDRERPGWSKDEGRAARYVPPWKRSDRDNQNRPPRRPSGERRGYWSEWDNNNEEGGERRERRPFNREGGDRDRKPFRRDENASGDRERRPFNREGGDRERKPFRRDENASGDRERRPFNREGGDRERKPFRRDENASGDRERRPFNR
ncbi:MAG: pseudouridine synthase, partial [Anaerolineae bacterium]|nr:pseudouridine synthase [Anaerolineae bacterium]